MKRLMLLLMLSAPLASMAQVDDVYFVPKKEKSSFAAKSSDESFFVDVEEYYAGDDSKAEFWEDEASGTLEVDTTLCMDNAMTGRGNFFYTNDPELFYESNFGDSALVVRFRYPSQIYGEKLYWDLVYGCGINDWLVYDTGYGLEIYPTINNPLFHLGRQNLSLSLFNYSTWGVYGSWLGLYEKWHLYRPSWYSHSWCYHDNYWRYHNHVNRYGKPGYMTFDKVPVNSEIYTYEGELLRKGRGGTTIAGTTGRDRGGVLSSSLGTQRRPLLLNSGNIGGSDKGSSREDDRAVSFKKERNRRGGSGATLNGLRQNNRGETPVLRRQQPRRDGGLYTSNQIADKSGDKDGAVSGMRRQQPRRENGFSLRANGDKGNQSSGTAVQRREPRRNTSVGAQENNTGSRSGNATNVRQIRRSGERSYSGGSSSNGYNRPSSTSVNRSSGNSYRGGTSTGRSGSYYGSGSGSSYSNSSGTTSGGGSRGGSSGGSRGGSRGGRR